MVRLLLILDELAASNSVAPKLNKLTFALSQAFRQKPESILAKTEREFLSFGDE